jgi:hypothetical protein
MPVAMRLSDAFLMMFLLHTGDGKLRHNRFWGVAGASHTHKTMCVPRHTCLWVQSLFQCCTARFDQPRIIPLFKPHQCNWHLVQMQSQIGPNPGMMEPDTGPWSLLFRHESSLVPILARGNPELCDCRCCSGANFHWPSSCLPPQTWFSPDHRILTLLFGQLGELFHFGGDFLARPFVAPNLRLQTQDFAIG